MKNLLSKNFKKKTNKIYSYNQLAMSGSDTTDTIIGDPTNTTITVLTTVSGQGSFRKSLKGNENQGINYRWCPRNMSLCLRMR